MAEKKCKRSKPTSKHEENFPNELQLTQVDNGIEMEKWELVPPDGGWGWLVLFGATLVNLLIPGTIKSFGVLFVEFLEVFQATPVSASWIPALCYFLYSSLGPVSSVISVKYSYRTVTIIGGTFAAVGMMLSYFAKSIAFLYISYGVLVGIGAGLAFPPTVYIVTSYFLRLRGIANGICISGSSIGSIILPPFLRYLLDKYGYRGAVLIMGGITLHCWVAALFYDPVEKHLRRVLRKGEVKQDLEKQVITNNKVEVSLMDDNDYPTELDSFLPSSPNTNTLPHNKGCEENIEDSTKITKQFSSASTLQTTPISKISNSTDVNIQIRKRSRPPRSPSTSSFQYVSTPYHGSTLTLQPEVFASSFSLKASTQKTEQVQKTNLFDISLLKDPLYLVILLSNSTNAISYTNFIILLPSYALTLGYDKTNAALLLSVVSALDLIGRIGGSALSDVTKFPKEWYFISGLFVSGFTLALLPLAKTYTLLSIFCAVFGLASGIYVGITAVIMTHLLGQDRLQSSYGISLFVNGILQLIGPPVCGLCFQSINSYLPIFSGLGIILIVGSSFWIVVPFIKKK